VLAEAALPVAIDLARSVTGRLVLLSVAPWPQGSHTPHDAHTLLAAPADRVAQAGVAVQTAVRTGEPATEIARAARDHSAAAVVMATHGRTGLKRTIMGSIAGQVVHRSPSPVMLVRPPGLHPIEDPVTVQWHAPAPA